MKHTIRIAPLVLMILGIALLAATAATAAKAPGGKTYFIVSLGVATDDFEAYDLDVGCITFTDTEICQASGGSEDCGSWRRSSSGKQTKKEMSFVFEFSLIDDETGLPVEIEGQARIDTRGRKSSIGGVAQALEPISGTKINFAMAGRAVGAARCARLVEDFATEN